MKLRHLPVLILTVLPLACIVAQNPDSLVIPRHRHLKANLTMTAFNITLNRGNRYLLESGKDWADVSWSSWKKNLSSWPEWDWDLYTTNWFAHPYQGSIYYNCARSLKMNYGQSMAYALLGTAIWEYLGEDLPPSGNDFIATTTGGIFLGEILFRLSENILDDRTYGGKRRKKEIFSALVNPIGSINRLFYNQINQHEEFKNHLQVPVRTRLGFSAKYLSGSSRPSEQLIIPELTIRLDYGRRKTNGEIYKPFELFWMDAWLRFDKYKQDQDRIQMPLPYLNLSGSAILYGKARKAKSGYHGLWGVFQDYDYLNNYNYAFSAISFTLGADRSFGNDAIWNSLRIQAGPVILAAVESEAINQVRPENVGLERDYIMGPGYTFKLKNNLNFSKFGSLELTYDFWHIIVESGPEGGENIHRLFSQYLVNTGKNMAVGMSYSYYHRLGDYKYLSGKPRLKAFTSELQLSLYLNLNK